MTKRLEELFNLDNDEEIIEESVNDSEEQIEPTVNHMNNLDKIDSALPRIKGLEASDSEMDEIADLALSSYKDLFEMGMNVDSRSAAEILHASSNFLSHAITARTAKINKKLKMIELQLKKAKLDQTSSKDSDNETGSIGQAKLLDRNELLKEIINQQKK